MTPVVASMSQLPQPTFPPSFVASVAAERQFLPELQGVSHAHVKECQEREHDGKRDYDNENDVAAVATTG
jgi:hypothetical protein